MVRFKCLIIEDEPLASEILQEYIGQVPFLQFNQTCSDALTALEYLKTKEADVLFVDIHLPRLNGLDFLKTLKHPPQVIITTAYREYALEGFEHNAVDYLLKPISFHRFLTAVNKLKASFAIQDIVTHNSKPDTDDRQHIYINVNKKRVRINLDDILFIESKKEYISIVTNDKALLTKYQLSEIKKQLDETNFIRVHRSYIISKSKVTAYTATNVEINGNLISIGRSYKERVLSLLGNPI